MCKRFPPEAILFGLYKGKGQRMCDLVAVNPDLTKEQILLRLEALLEQGSLEKYDHCGDAYYMLKLSQ